MKTYTIFSEAISLPVEKKTQLVEQLLESLHPTQKKIDLLWAKESEKRVREIHFGKIKLISGEEVFKKIKKRLSD